jgi:hypothetical protein
MNKAIEFGEESRAMRTKNPADMMRAPMGRQRPHQDLAFMMRMNKVRLVKKYKAPATPAAGLFGTYSKTISTRLGPEEWWPNEEPAAMTAEAIERLTMSGVSLILAITFLKFREDIRRKTAISEKYVLY